MVTRRTRFFWVYPMVSSKTSRGQEAGNTFPPARPSHIEQPRVQLEPPLTGMAAAATAAATTTFGCSFYSYPQIDRVRERCIMEHSCTPGLRRLTYRR